MHNIMIQNCKQEWDREGPLSWDDLISLAESALPFQSFIDVNAHMFFNPDNMLRRIQQFCEKTGQSIPQTRGEIARTVYESLAMSYRTPLGDWSD